MQLFKSKARQVQSKSKTNKTDIIVVDVIGPDKAVDRLALTVKEYVLIKARGKKY